MISNDIPLESIPSGDGDDSETEINDVADDAQEAAGLDAHEKADLQRMADRLAKLKVDSADDDVVDSLMSAQHDEVRGIDSNKVSSGSGTHAQFDRIANTLDEMRKQQVAAADSGKISWQRIKWWAFVTGLVIGSSMLALRIYELVTKGEADGLTEDEKKQIKDTCTRWNALSSTDFWGRIADYMDRWKPSWTAQLLWMTYAKQLNPILQGTPSIWHWSALDDEINLAEKCANAYADSDKIGDLYRTVATLTYAGDPAQPDVTVSLPKWIAADVCEKAIGWIVDSNSSGNSSNNSSNNS